MPEKRIKSFIRKLKKIKLRNVALTGMPMNGSAVVTRTFIKSLRNLKVEGKPFAGYKDFDDCVRKNSDKSNPKAYCAEIMRKVEGKDMEEKATYPWDECIRDQMRRYGSKEKAEKICGAIRAGTVRRKSVDEYYTVKQLIEDKGGNSMTEETKKTEAKKEETKTEVKDSSKDFKEIKKSLKSITERLDKLEKKEDESAGEEDKDESGEKRIETLETEVKELKELLAKPELKARAEQVTHEEETEEPEGEKSIISLI